MKKIKGESKIVREYVKKRFFKSSIFYENKNNLFHILKFMFHKIYKEKNQNI